MAASPATSQTASGAIAAESWPEMTAQRRFLALVSHRQQLVHIRRPDVVAHDRAEEHRVEAVERAAVGPEQAAGVLGAGLALDEGLEQIADRGDERHAEPEHER